METPKTNAEQEKVTKFKSYYVVWKRNQSGKARGMHLWFKSYYVVWKLVTQCRKKTVFLGLNRTM